MCKIMLMEICIPTTLTTCIQLLLILLFVKWVYTTRYGEEKKHTNCVPLLRNALRANAIIGSKLHRGDLITTELSVRKE